MQDSKKIGSMGQRAFIYCPLFAHAVSGNQWNAI